MNNIDFYILVFAPVLIFIGYKKHDAIIAWEDKQIARIKEWLSK